MNIKSYDKVYFWVGGWMDVKAFLRIAHRIKKRGKNTYAEKWMALKMTVIYVVTFIFDED